MAAKTQAPQYRGKTAIRIARDATPADLKDFWARGAVPPAPPPTEVAGSPQESPDDSEYLAAIRRVFAPRTRPWLPSPGNYPIPHQGPCATGCGRQGLFRLEEGPDDRWLCHNCLVASGAMPRRIKPPPPMSGEEQARRRAERAAEEAVRRWRGDDLAWDRSAPVFLKVPHRDAAGRSVPKMVGKLDLCNVAMIQAIQRDVARVRAGDRPTEEWLDLAETGTTEPVYFHAHSSSQRHFQTNCPAPLDSVVADFLRRSDIGWVFDFERPDGEGSGVLRWAPIYRMKSAPEIEYDGRWRLYLPDERWEILLGVREYRRKDGSVLLHINPERDLIFRSPFIPEENALILRRGRRVS